MNENNQRIRICPSCKEIVPNGNAICKCGYEVN